MNDLTTRNHVDIMVMDADDRQEYNEYLDSLDEPQELIDSDFIATVTSPEVVAIENDIHATIERQCRIAEQKFMSLDEYRENLHDRRDILMNSILHARAIARIQNAK